MLRWMAFHLDAETAHELTISFCSKNPWSASLFSSKLDEKKYGVNVGKLRWHFPVGLAAGLDKNANAIDFFSRLMFGAIEVGTVTPLPQEGNPKPRLFRLTEEKSLRNQMGFNNAGFEVVKGNIPKVHRKPIGINIGKNKLTQAHKAPEDYRVLYQHFRKIADYIVINVSSPNTPGLRDLQQKSFLTDIFNALTDLRLEFNCPLYLKISPDLNEKNIIEAVEICREKKLDGIIATNTTIMEEKGHGGISGQLLYSRSKIIRDKVLDLTKDDKEFNVIGVGGFSNYQQVWEFWKNGGKVVQIYSSFIYQGPKILADIKNSIDKSLLKYNLKSVEELLTNIKDINDGP